MTDFTSTTSINAATFAEVSKFAGVYGNTKSIHKVNFLAQSSVFRGTHIAQAVYALEWARTTGRFSGEVEMAIRKMSPYQVLKLCFNCKAGTVAECLENFKAAFAPKQVEPVKAVQVQGETLSPLDAGIVIANLTLRKQSHIGQPRKLAQLDAQVAEVETQKSRWLAQRLSR